MSHSQSSQVILQPSRLRTALSSAFHRIGLGLAEAHRIADSLVAAECGGVPTHGLLRVPWYVEDLRRGRYRPAGTPIVEERAPGVLAINGHGALGYFPTWCAVEAASERAKSTGVAAAIVHNIGEFGRAGYYAEEAARRGVVALVCQNTAPLLSSPGSSVATHGNNPLAFSSPGTDAPLYDGAFTPRSGGELRRRQLLGMSLPLEWGYRDIDGEPTSDPAAAMRAVLPAVGGAKGFGLAVLVDLLAGILSGANSGPSVRPDHTDTGAMVLVFHPAAFSGADAIAHAMSVGAGAVRAAGGRWPGDRFRSERERALEADAVNVPWQIYEAVLAAGVDLGSLADP